MFPMLERFVRGPTLQEGHVFPQNAPKIHSDTSRWTQCQGKGNSKSPYLSPLQPNQLESSFSTQIPLLCTRCPTDPIRHEQERRLQVSNSSKKIPFTDFFYCTASCDRSPAPAALRAAAFPAVSSLSSPAPGLFKRRLRSSERKKTPSPSHLPAKTPSTRFGATAPLCKWLKLGKFHPNEICGKAQGRVWPRGTRGNRVTDGASQLVAGPLSSLQI